MLTRLCVTGFKNLVETEVRFGPVTCLAGLNGVGKSNLFDAIHFLSELADKKFDEAAATIRGGADVADIFTHGGDGVMRFHCEMLIPSTGLDEFNQPTVARCTFLTYEVGLLLEADAGGQRRVRLLHEKLAYVPRRWAEERLGFEHADSWREATALWTSNQSTFIHLVGEGDDQAVQLNADAFRDDIEAGRGPSRPTSFLIGTSPRTGLSSAQNGAEVGTAVLARNEMRSWRTLQLEPAKLREPDGLQMSPGLRRDGRGLARTLYELATNRDPARVYGEVAGRVLELVGDVQSIRVQRDDALRKLSVMMTDRAGLELPAASLSDGTLRFLALCVLEQDPHATGVICLEEPENGIHPGRLGAIMRLLGDIAVDPFEPADKDNPLRQLVVSTHSPVLAACVRPDELLFADLRDAPGRKPGSQRSLVVRPIHDTWRERCSVSPVARGRVLHYLSSLNPDKSANPDSRTVFDLVSQELDLVSGASE